VITYIWVYVGHPNPEAENLKRLNLIDFCSVKQEVVLGSQPQHSQTSSGNMPGHRSSA